MWWFLAPAAVVVLAPVAAVLGSLMTNPSGVSAWREPGRLFTLASTSGSLALIAALTAVPLGTLLGFLLERTAVRGRSALTAVLTAGVFVPLSVYAVAWQVVLGRWLPPIALDPGTIAWRPWHQGVLPAGFVHGMAGVPWVAWAVRLGLRTTDRTLEDQALIDGGPGLLIRRVWLPRVVLAAFFGGLWVVVQTLTEIAVTDAMMVRTFAEEVYTQLVAFPNGVSGAVAVTVPVWLAAGTIVVPIVCLCRDRFRPSTDGTGHTRTVGHSLVTPIAWLIVVGCAGLPVLALLSQAGRTTADGWTVANLGVQFARVARLSGVSLAEGVLTATGVGVTAGTIAAVACWHVARRPRAAVGFWIVIVLVWLTPGPILGLGLKRVIAGLMDLDDVFGGSGLVARWLYDGPSALPGAWAAVIRYLPVAVVILWPTVQSLPRELFDAAAIDGVSAWRWVGWPALKSPLAAATVAVAVLSLGEVAAGKLVAPPGQAVFILDLFNQMHYGAEATVAAMCLVQLAVVGLGVWLLARLTA